MLPFEKALKRLEKKKNYKPELIDFWNEYLKIFRHRENFLYSVIHNSRERNLYNDAEIAVAQKEKEVVEFLTKILESKIFKTKDGGGKNVKEIV